MKSFSSILSGLKFMALYFNFIAHRNGRHSMRRMIKTSL